MSQNCEQLSRFSLSFTMYVQYNNNKNNNNNNNNDNDNQNTINRRSNNNHNDNHKNNDNYNNGYNRRTSMCSIFFFSFASCFFSSRIDQ